MKILIAEDDSISRHILEAILLKWGYDVVSASDGDEAWNKMREEGAPRLAVLDWMMPGMEGVELCRRIRRESGNKPLYIILLTARGEKDDIVEGLSSGADDYILKPFDKDELRARIDVGRRIIKLQTELLEKEKLQVIFEITGAICHELNQPLQVISANSDLLLIDIKEDDPIYKNIKKIKNQVGLMGQITKKLMKVTRYQTKDYLSSKIIDIDTASMRAE